MLLSCNASLLFSQETSHTLPGLKEPLYTIVAPVGGGEEGWSGRAIVSFSPNGKMFARHTLQSSNGFMTATSRTSELGVFSIDSGVKKLTIPNGWRGFAFSPDDKHFLSWDANAISHWSLDRADAIAVLQLFDVQEVTYVRKGEWFVTKTHKGEVKFWDAINLKPIPTPIDQRGPWHDSIVTPDGRLFIGFKGPSCSILEVATGVALPSPTKVSPGHVFSFRTRVTANGQYVVFNSELKGGERNGTSSPVVYWNLATSQPRALGSFFRYQPNSLLSRQGNDLLALCTSDEESSVYVENVDKQWLLKKVFSDEVVREFPDQTKWKSSDSGQVRILANDRMVVSLIPAQSWNIRDFDLTSGKQNTLIQTDQQISKMAISPDGKRLATSQTSQDSIEPRSESISVWDTENLKQLFEINRHKGPLYQIPISFIDFSPDGRLITSATRKIADTGTESEVLVWDGLTGHHLAALSSNELPSKIHAISHDGALMACSKPNEIHILDAMNFTLKQKLIVDTLPTRKGYPKPGLGIVHKIAFSIDGKKLAALSHFNGDMQLTYWALSKGRLAFLTNSLPGYVADLEFIDNGAAIQIFSWGYQKVIIRKLYDLNGMSSGQQVYSYPSSDREFDLREPFQELFKIGNLPKNRLSVVGKFSHANDFVCRVVQWEPSTGKLLRTTNLDNYTVESAIATNDGNRLFTLGISTPDQTAYIMDASSGEVLSTFERSAIDTCSPNGKYVLVKDHTVKGLLKVWNTETGTELGRISDPGLGSGQGIFSPDNQHFFLTSGSVVYFWSVDQFNKTER